MLENKEAQLQTNNGTTATMEKSRIFGVSGYCRGFSAFWQTTDWLHILWRLVTVGDSNSWALQKHSKPIWGLSSSAWNSPINYLRLFSPDVLRTVVSKKCTTRILLWFLQGAVSPGGPCRKRWSFKVTDVSQMSNKLHGKKMSLVQGRFNHLFFPQVH